MRIGIRLRPAREASDAAAAEAIGAFGVLVDPGDDTWSVAAATAATATRFTRVVVRVPLGCDHPITLAEDLAVLDHVSGGRVVALVDTEALDVDAAREDLALLRAGLTARPVQHAGARWRVPAGIEGHEAPDAIQVTPQPTQVEIPVWLVGEAAAQLADLDLPRLVTKSDDVDAARHVQPGMDHLPGDREVGRDLVGRWAAAGATHLILGADDLDAALPEIGRYLIPEVAMPHFPRIVAEALTPPRWEGPARYVEVPSQ